MLAERHADQVEDFTLTSDMSFVAAEVLSGSIQVLFHVFEDGFACRSVFKPGLWTLSFSINQKHVAGSMPTRYRS